MSDTTPPDEWAKLLARNGVSGQQDLARRMSVSPATVNRLVRGMGRPSSETVRAAAEILSGGDTDVIWKLVGTGHFDYGDFPVDKIADDLRLLTPKQRSSLLAIVKAMADPEGKGTGHVETPAEKSDELDERRRVSPYDDLAEALIDDEDSRTKSERDTQRRAKEDLG